jgi:hypothetical protein
LSALPPKRENRRENREEKKRLFAQDSILVEDANPARVITSLQLFGLETFVLKM